MIIGQFVDTYPPQVDGVGRVTQAYCNTMKAMGHTPYYIAPNSPDFNDDFGFITLLSKSLPVKGELFRAGVPMLDPAFRAQLDSIPFDIVHAHSPFLAWSEAHRVAKKRDIPLVTTFHSKYYDDALSKTHSKTLAKLAVKGIVMQYEKTDAVWTLNNGTADVLREYGYKGKLLIMPNGTDIEPLDPAVRAEIAARLNLPQDEPVLLFVGQHHYKKNIHGVLQACRLLLNNGQRFQLVMAGDGPDYDAIVAETKALGISDRCHFMGFVTDRAKLLSLYDLADLFVFPSLYDNAPMVLRQAASMATPSLLVAGSCSAQGVEDGVNGFISPDESAEAIEQTIQRALPHCKQVGQKAKETIPISWQSIIQRVLHEYEMLISSRH